MKRQENRTKTGQTTRYIRTTTTNRSTHNHNENKLREDKHKTHITKKTWIGSKPIAITTEGLTSTPITTTTYFTFNNSSTMSCLVVHGNFHHYKSLTHFNFLFRRFYLLQFASKLLIIQCYIIFFCSISFLLWEKMKNLTENPVLLSA